MKTLVVLTLVALFFLSACMNEYRFRIQDTGENSSAPVPDNNEVNHNPDVGSPKPDEPIIDPDQPLFPVTYKIGDCTKESVDVLPCLSCQITQKPIEIPLSIKGSQLLEIMDLGCQILNKSDPAGYKPPSRQSLLKFLNRADSINYPDSAATARQKVSLSKWLANDKNHLSKLFGGLWYQPPYSEDFETYFGLEPKEARYFFCYQDPASAFSAYTIIPLYSANYSRCLFDGGPAGCRESANYIAANQYRKQLVNSLYQGIYDPYNTQELVPANKCFWESMSGHYNAEMETKLIDWKNKGYEMAVYFETDHPRCEKLSTALIPLNAKVTVAGKLCVDF